MLPCPFSGQEKKLHFMSNLGTHSFFRITPEDWNSRLCDQTAGVMSLNDWWPKEGVSCRKDEDVHFLLINRQPAVIKGR